MEVIAAISTPFGKAGVAVIRLSGDEDGGAVAIAERIFSPASGKAFGDCAPRTAVLGTLCMPDGDREEIDTVLCTHFPAPHSFTGEDTVEISCHGGILVTSRVLTACLAAGARQARAGEFTRRAFLKGKMNLGEAEALGALLEAENGEQLRLARAGMKGVLTEKTASIYGDLTRVMASVFARIDYPDEDLADLSREEILAVVETSHAALVSLADTYRTGHAIASGIPTVICGRANAGKSSLYNLLTGKDAAIVTDIAGTTRDVLTDTVSVGRVTLRLSDTAGLRETADTVEKIGVERAGREMEKAELILAVFDSSSAATKDDLALITSLKEKHVPVIALRNKTDLAPVFDATLLDGFTVVSVSAKHGDGKDALVSAVEGLFIDGTLDTVRDAILVNARQYSAVMCAVSASKRAADALRGGFALDLCCDDIAATMQALSELDGKEVGEDVVSEIFSHFCVGK